MKECSVCHSKLVYKKITYIQWYHKKLVAVENVPADTCQNCGEEYFAPDTVDRIQKTIELNHISKKIELPIFQLV